MIRSFCRVLMNLFAWFEPCSLMTTLAHALKIKCGVRCLETVGEGQVFFTKDRKPCIRYMQLRQDRVDRYLKSRNMTPRPGTFQK